MPLLFYLQLGDTPTAATIEACYVTCIFTVVLARFVNESLG